MKFDDLWGKFKKEAFRLELLQEYKVKEEEKAFLYFKENREVRYDLTDYDIWEKKYLSRIKNDRVKVKRVHVIEKPLSDYIEFELGLYRTSQRMGEEISLLSKDAYDKIIADNIFSDYWLFDDETVLEMSYGIDGNYLSSVTIDKDIQKWIDLKNKLIEQSTTLNKYKKEGKI